MKSLYSVVEGLLDKDLDSKVDQALDSKVAQELISTLKNIKWEYWSDESNNGHQIYKAKDQDKALKALLRAVKKAIKNGQEHKYIPRTPFSKIPDSFIVSCMDDKEWPYIAFINPHLPDIYYLMRQYYYDEKIIWRNSMDNLAAKDADIRAALRTGINNHGFQSSPDARCIDILVPIPLWEPLINAIKP